MTYVLVDYETASQCDLLKCGAYVYAEDPTTEVLSFGGIWPDGSIEVYNPFIHGDDLPPRLQAALEDPKIMIIAHNAQFEKQMLRRHCVPVLGWPDVPNGRWHDTMAVAAQKAMPQKLEKLAQALRLHHKKDTAASRFTVSLSKHNKDGSSRITPEAIERVVDYNITDLHAQKEVLETLGDFQEGERKVWLLDQKINERGIRLDTDYIHAAQVVVDKALVPLIEEFKELAGGLVPTQSAKLLDWMSLCHGIDTPSLDKEHVAEILKRDDISDDCRRALTIKQTAGSTSVKKLKAMHNCVCADGRARGTLSYHGTGPGRWAGRLMAPHNYPRGMLGQTDPDYVVSQMMSESPEIVAQAFGDILHPGRPEEERDIYGDAIEAVISGLRHAMISSPNRLFVVGDFASIQARIVLALAGQVDALEILQDENRDIYSEMASQIFNCEAPYGPDAIKKFKEENLEYRQTGKNTVLGAGFQMGDQKFQEKYAKDKPIEFCTKAIKTYREDFAPKVPRLWKNIQEASLAAVKERRPVEAHGVLFKIEDDWLTARLHSGRKLYYREPRIGRKAMPWDDTDIRECWTYKAWKLGQWRTVYAYGGLQTENIVMGLERDLLVESMFKCEENGLPVILNVYDEDVCEPTLRDADEELLRQIMEDRPQWAVELGIPIATEIWSGTRYKK